jgi:hypothetical protein
MNRQLRFRATLRVACSSMLCPPSMFVHGNKQRKSDVTIETPDSLHHNSFVSPANANEALAAYFAVQALVCGPSLPTPNSGQISGYRSTWEIRSDRLYLMQLNPVGQSDTCGTPRQCPVGGAEGLLAEWFTGVICVDDAKVNILEDEMDPLQSRPVVALHFERGIFENIRRLSLR